MYPKTILNYLFVFLIAILISTPFVILSLNSSKYNEILNVVIYTVTLLSFTVLVDYINHKRKINVVYNIKPFKIPFLFYTILIVWIYQLIIVAPINLYFYQKQDFNVDLYWVLTYLVVAPILEELVFRNIILNSLLNSYGKNKAIVISSIIFGLVHGVFPQILFAGVLGLFLGLIYSKNKNIAHTMIIHFFANLFVIIPKYYETNFSNSSFFYMGIGLNILITFFLIYFMYKKYGFSLLKLIKEK